MSEQGTEHGLTRELKASVRKEALTQVAKWTVGAVVVLFGIAATGWWLYLKNNLDEYIRTRVEGMPASAVVAFDLPEGCPRGWTAFQDAAGRAVIGVGKGNGLTPREFRDRQGIEVVVLTPNHMPQHQHDTLVALGSTSSPWGPGPAKTAAVGRDWQTFATALSGPAGKNPPDPISTMPPFIVLQYCKKNA
jgi:hypothetical protein